MKTLTVKKITKSYPNKSLFEDVSFSVTQGDRMAITGANGVGKSTLLKIISGQESYDSGKIIKEKCTCEYISQEFTGDTTMSILEYLDQTKATSKVFDLIQSFSVITEKQIEDGFIHELSGGQKRVLEITCVLSRAPMFLCIDEPENHLDIKSRVVLSNLLQGYWGAVIFVSHDRFLINEISNKIFALQSEHSVLTVGKTYEEFLEAEKLQTLGDLARWKAEARALDKLEETVRMLKKRTRYNDAQAKTYQMKKRQLDERQSALGKQPVVEVRVPSLAVGQVKQKEGKLIFEAKDVGMSYAQDHAILENVTGGIRFGEKVVLLGRNGSGKTTFLNLVTQKASPTTGALRFGTDLVVEYIDQSNTFDSSMSPLEHFRDRGFNDERSRRLLAQFLFTQSEAETALKILSGGQQQRFRFLLLFKVNPEFIILDEPTNNLDPGTWELLLGLMNEYTGSLLLVTHDQSFIDQLAEKKVWVLKNKTIVESWKSLDQILAAL